MPIDILMPALSPTMEEGTLAKWLVKEGDTVASGDILAEIETDKATMEFEAVDEGVIGTILVAEGTSAVKVNSPIAVLLEDGEDASAVSQPAAPTASPATASGAAEPAAPMAKSEVVQPNTGDTGTSDQGRVFASPLARRIAQSKGIDLSAIVGSGPKGRIVKADVEAANPGMAAAQAAHASAAPEHAAPSSVPAPSAPVQSPPVQTGSSQPDFAKIAQIYDGRTFEEIQLDGMRKTIAARLTEAKQTIPHFYLRRDIALDALLAFRSELNGQLSARGIKLSVNDFIIKACALALQQVPAANAVWAGDRILQMQASDVAVAVAIDGGLYTPVLKDAEQKSLSALSVQMKDLAERARNRKLAPHEFQGGSFAISNLGMMGIENFDAVINPPHGAILAVGAGLKKPVVNAEGALDIATVMSVTLSVDHRVIDGAVGAELLGAIKHNLENPLAMLA